MKNRRRYITAERNALACRIGELEKFIISDKYLKLTGPSKCAIEYQLAHMRAYLGMLDMRLNLL